MTCKCLISKQECMVPASDINKTLSKFTLEHLAVIETLFRNKTVCTILTPSGDVCQFTVIMAASKLALYQDMQLCLLVLWITTN